MGLLTPVELPLPNELGAVHFIAIGGSGMNGIASMMLAQESASAAAIGKTQIPTFPRGSRGTRPRRASSRAAW